MSVSVSVNKGGRDGGVDTYWYSHNDEMLERDIQRWKMTPKRVHSGRRDRGMMNSIKGTIKV